MPDQLDLLTLARRLLPEGAMVASADPRQLHALLPGEALPRALPARLAEFSAGRHAARQALQQLGLPASAIPAQPDRAPLWPEGISGTITHSRSQCLAAARRGAGIGLDLEEAEDLPCDLWDSILSATEQLWAKSQVQPGLSAKLIFSAKEAAYKAQYARSGHLFGFEVLQVAVSGDCFTATFVQPVPPFAAGRQLHGRWGIAGGHILTAAWL